MIPRARSLLLRRFAIAALFLAAVLDCPAAIHSRHPAPPVDPNVPVPVITFDQMSFDFGKIAAEKPVVHSFIVSNTGKATLHIEEVKAICGCTSTLVGKKDLEVGETTEIQVAYTPEKGFSGAARKTIVVSSNDPARPKLTLRFAADVLPGAATKPSS
jgi:hypothetical protein